MQEWLEFEHATETTTQFNQTFMRKQIVHMGETEDPFICVTRIVDSLCEKLGGDDAVLAATSNSTVPIAPRRTSIRLGPRCSAWKAGPRP